MISTAGSRSTDTGTLMNDKTVGLILKEQDYRESSVILTVLTKEYGKISLVAQSARKMTSKNRGSILPYTKGEFFFDFKETRTMFRLKTAHTIEMYRYLHEDLNASLAIAVIAEVMDAFLLESADFELSSHFYALFEETCTALNERHRADIVLAVTLADLLDVQGIGPDVDECVLCGNTNVAAISVRDGGFLCADCAAGHGVSLNDLSSLRAFRLINKAKLAHCSILEEHMDSAMETCTLLVEFLRQHAGLSVRSFPLFQQMFQV